MDDRKLKNQLRCRRQEQQLSCCSQTSLPPFEFTAARRHTMVIVVRATTAPRKPNASHNRARASVRARPNALQVEALLDRNAPTTDNNI
ncbi:hypothetical protein HPB52_002507 [Rhipicephalus sanguineus]|uniref:Uncharacterized protein n=1 Tax=Rhipicephalus sanguineus TaxID=34632 RepID=A0A9D4ST64_RHISA|nr:hypothetical protein HPB52_002507 [Rhipicephalus sanguineus]